MAFITESGGPYGFSLNESFAYESYSSSEGRTRAAPPCGCCVACANRSIDGLRPITPTAVATPPTNLRRETVFRSSTIASQWKSPPSSVFHLPSSIFHLPSSIFHLPSSLVVTSSSDPASITAASGLSSPSPQTAQGTPPEAPAAARARRVRSADSPS